MNMAVLEHKRERNRSPPIEVKSKFCSSVFYLLEWLILLKLSEKRLKKHTNKFRTAKKVHLSTTVDNKHFIQICHSKILYAI